MVEERVGGDLYFVEMDVRVVGVHADGRGVADEVHVVSAGGQFGAEFGGHHAGAAVGWVAGYPDAHKLFGTPGRVLFQRYLSGGAIIGTVAC